MNYHVAADPGNRKWHNFPGNFFLSFFKDFNSSTGAIGNVMFDFVLFSISIPGIIIALTALLEFFFYFYAHVVKYAFCFHICYTL